MKMEFGNSDNITFNEEEFEEFKKIYETNSSNKEIQFSYKGKIFLTNYAKYLIEYLADKFK
jgi:hypothetical protein